MKESPTPPAPKKKKITVEEWKDLLGMRKSTKEVQ